MWHPRRRCSEWALTHVSTKVLSLESVMQGAITFLTYFEIEKHGLKRENGKENV